MSLNRELETYRRELPNWLAQGMEGRFVLIHGDQVIGIWDQWDEALRQGYERFLHEPFLTKEIVQSEKPLYFSRNV